MGPLAKGSANSGSVEELEADHDQVKAGTWPFFKQFFELVRTSLCDSDFQGYPTTSTLPLVLSRKDRPWDTLKELKKK